MRLFKLCSITTEGNSPPISLEEIPGPYEGRITMIAAKKIFCRICQIAASHTGTQDGLREYVFSIQEENEDSKGEISEWYGNRSGLDEPQKVNVGGEEHIATVKFVGQ